MPEQQGPLLHQGMDAQKSMASSFRMPDSGKKSKEERNKGKIEQLHFCIVIITFFHDTVN